MHYVLTVLDHREVPNQLQKLGYKREKEEERGPIYLG